MNNLPAEKKPRYPYWALWIGLIFIAAWLVGISPPLLEHFSFVKAASIVRFLYRFFCHGIPDRCPWIFAKPAAVCFRCTGIDLSFFIGCSILFPLLRNYINWKKAVFFSAVFSTLLFAEWISEFFMFNSKSFFSIRDICKIFSTWEFILLFSSLIIPV